jgi:hypothetical protein
MGSLSEIMRRDMSAAVSTRRASRRVTNEVARATERLAGDAVVRAARVQAGAYVAHVGQALTASLTDEELRSCAMYPERAYRFKAIGDSYAGLVVRTIAEMGFDA